MVSWKLLFYRAMRGFFESVWPNPGAWIYWDRKVLAARKDSEPSG